MCDIFQIGVNVPGNMMPTSSNRQHYPPSNIFHQEIARPYIPPYHTPISNNKTNHVNESDTQQGKKLKGYVRNYYRSE